MGKKHLLERFKRRRQDVVILTGFRGMADDSLDMVEDKGYAANPSTREAWGIDETNQILDQETGKTIQLLTAWNAAPVRLFGEENSRINQSNINALASRVTDEAIAWEEEQKHRDLVVFWSAIIAFILSLGIVIPVLKAVFSGQLRIPFLGG